MPVSLDEALKDMLGMHARAALQSFERAAYAMRPRWVVAGGDPAEPLALLPDFPLRQTQDPQQGGPGKGRGGWRGAGGRRAEAWASVVSHAKFWALGRAAGVLAAADVGGGGGGGVTDGGCCSKSEGVTEGRSCNSASGLLPCSLLHGRDDGGDGGEAGEGSDSDEDADRHQRGGGGLLVWASLDGGDAGGGTAALKEDERDRWGRWDTRNGAQRLVVPRVLTAAMSVCVPPDAGAGGAAGGVGVGQAARSVMTPWPRRNETVHQPRRRQHVVDGDFVLDPAWYRRVFFPRYLAELRHVLAAGDATPAAGVLSLVAQALPVCLLPCAACVPAAAAAPAPASPGARCSAIGHPGHDSPEHAAYDDTSEHAAHLKHDPPHSPEHASSRRRRRRSRSRSNATATKTVIMAAAIDYPVEVFAAFLAPLRRVYR